MKWKCKFCTFSSANQRSIIRHYKLKHGHYGRYCPLPCIYSDCVCSFKTQVALKNHLLKHETGTNPLGFLSRSGPFGTDHKRSTFFKDNFPVIEPVEYVLDADGKK
ncbi:hypothetical protein F7725_024264, partial [Dissostichus mawsoni]